MSKLSRRDFCRRWIVKGGLLVPFSGPIIRRASAQILRNNNMLQPLNSGGGGTPVAFDVAFEKGASSQPSTFSFVSNAGTTSGSIAANSNRVLIAAVGFKGITSSAVAITWNSVGMTAIGSKLTIASTYDLYLFGLINPASGAQTILASWTGGTATSVWLGALSLYNVNQTTAWQNNGTDNNTGTTASSTVTSANNNMGVVFHLNDNATTTTWHSGSGTQGWIDTNLDGNTTMGYKASTGASVALQVDLGSSKAWGHQKVDIIAA